MLDIEFLSFISTLIYIVLLIVFIVKKIKTVDIILYSIFYIYITAVIAITIFPIPIQGLQEIGVYYQTSNSNFIPLNSLLNIIENENLSFFIKIKQILGNIILFIPLGFLIPFIWKYKNTYKKVMIIGFICSFGIEFLQYFISLLLGFHYKVTDIDDILLNIIGSSIGFFLYKFSSGK